MRGGKAYEHIHHVFVSYEMLDRLTSDYTSK